MHKAEPTVAQIAHIMSVRSTLMRLFDCVQSNTRHRWEALRKLHALIDGNCDQDPYPVDWTKIFTPIERDAWSGFRGSGIYMRPQYPIGPYFVDFANPEYKIAFECDGKQWHDNGKDRARDEWMLTKGWVVFRATGSECKRYRAPPWESDEEDIQREQSIEWLNSTSDGLIYAIARLLFDESNESHYFSDNELFERLVIASSTFKRWSTNGYKTN